VEIEPRRSDTMRDDAKHLPPIPQSQETKRKAKSNDTPGSESKEKKVKQKVGKQSGAVDAGKKNGTGKQSGGVDPAKYAHLPVYDKEEERRKAREREKKMSQIFSEVNNQLEDITGLTSSHMENRGVKLVQSQQHYSDDVHTIRYNSGVLLPRQSECQTQVMKEKDIVEVHKVSSSSSQKNDAKIQIKDNDVQNKQLTELTQSKKEIGPLEASPFAQEERLAVENKPFGEEEEEFEEIGPGDLNDRDIPFIDSEDPATKLDRELENILEENLDLDLKVERIQLETSDRGSSSASLVVNHRFT